MKKTFAEKKKKFPLVFVREGFSLVELLLTLSITAIMIAAVLVSANGMNKDRKNLELAARTVAQAIRETQNNALGGKLPDKNDTSAYACGYAFAHGIGNNSYRIGYMPKTGGTPCASGSSLIMSPAVILKNNVTFTSGDRSMFFSLPRGEIYTANYDDSAPDMVLNNLLNPGEFESLTLISGDLRVDVCIYSSGKIEERPVRGVGAVDC